jgi:carboxymethylenebutenolidase
VIQLLPPNLPQDAQRLGPVPLDPPSSVKLAEEGFAVVAGCVNDGEYPLDVRKLVKVGLETLEKRDEVDGKERFAVLGASLLICVQIHWASVAAAYTQELLDQLLPLVSLHPKIACVIAFDGSSATSPVPLLSHIASSDPSPGKTTREGITTTHTYAGVQPHFWDVSAAVYTPGPSALSHTRTLVFLRTHLPGLDFDREAIWEEHCRYEFEERSVAKTMGTMVVRIPLFDSVVYA